MLGGKMNIRRSVGGKVSNSMCGITPFLKKK